MNNRETLIYVAIKFNGDYDRIMEAITTHEKIEIDENVTLPKNVITILDEDYPKNLYYAYKPPLVLFYKGDISLIKRFERTVSVVGSRYFSDYGEAVTKDIVKKLPKDVIVVSGLAKGIDSIAHHSAITSKHKTIGVLPCGIDACYPPESKDLYEEMSKNHLLLSEYPGDMPPQANYFHMRNRIIAYLSKATLVTEAHARSGTSITTAWALSACRDVCAVPHNVYRDSFCNHLISTGAYLVENSQDLVDILEEKTRNSLFEA